MGPPSAGIVPPRRRNLRNLNGASAFIKTAIETNRMKSEFLQQYDHTWKVLERIVDNFDDPAWAGAGRKRYCPARLAFHILHATKYYLEDKTETPFASGKSFEIDWTKAKAGELPSREDVRAAVKVWKEKTAAWISEMDIDSDNESFPWAGETKGGVALFLLRHTLFHLGELSSLLNESRNGEVEDHYVAAQQSES